MSSASEYPRGIASMDNVTVEVQEAIADMGGKNNDCPTVIHAEASQLARLALPTAYVTRLHGMRLGGTERGGEH